MPTYTPKEEAIEEKICTYLTSLGISCDKIVSGGFFDVKNNFFRKQKSQFARPGVSDIIGSIPPLGRALYIEVKKPSEMRLADRPVNVQEQELIDALYHKKLARASVTKYQHRVDQAKFIEEKLMTGAVAFFASSVEEARVKLLLFIK